MNLLNMLKLFNSGRKSKRFMGIFKNKQKNNGGWALISFVGIGALLSVLAKRNPSLAKPIKDSLEGIQRTVQPALKPQFGLNSMEFAKEFLTKLDQKDKSNSGQQDNKPIENKPKEDIL